MIQTSLTPAQASQEPLLTLKQDCEAPHTAKSPGTSWSSAAVTYTAEAEHSPRLDFCKGQITLCSLSPLFPCHQKISRQNKDELLAARTPQPLLL